MRFVAIEKTVPGMKLAKAIYDSYDRVLLNSGKILNGELISKLSVRGIPGVYIDDELTRNIVVQEVISNELRLQAVNSIREFNIDSTINISHKIVDQLLDSDSIMLDLIDLRTYDDYTYRHSVNVAVLTTIVGIAMNYKYDTLVNLCLAAILHDIGKIQIDTDILNKTTTLTEEEFSIIKEHPRIAHNLLKDNWDISSTTKIGILLHHENEDGSGYPMGLKGKEIHKFAKIIHVCDVYDALTSKRPYKEPYSPAESAEYLMGGGGTLFDKNIVELFLGYVPLYPKCTSVLLSNGMEAIVVENYKNNVLRPKVMYLSGEEIDLSSEDNFRNITIVGLI